MVLFALPALLQLVDHQLAVALDAESLGLAGQVAEPEKAGYESTPLRDVVGGG